MTTAHQRSQSARKLVVAFLIALLVGIIAHAAQLPPKIASTSKAMKKSAVAAASSRKIVLSWNQYTNVCFRIEATTNLSDWYFVTNIFPKWPTNCAFPANKKAEFFRIQTINQ